MNFRSRTSGRWREILLHFGVEKDLLNGKHQSCPTCGGKDRFRFDDKQGNGNWICTHCGAGEGGNLLMAIKGWSFRDMAEKVDDIVGRLEPVKIKPAQSGAMARARMLRAWEGSKKIERGDPVALWLNHRVGNILFPSCLRYSESTFHAGEPPTYHPAMIAKVDAPDGTAATIHRTYLTPEGRKAKVPQPRLLMPGAFPNGSAIRLREPRQGRLAVAEGIETALACMQTFALPTWSLINTTNMQAFTPPEAVTELFIFADHDASFAGQAAAYTLAKRLVDKIKVHVVLPERPGHDWNDVLNHHVKRLIEKSQEDAEQKNFGFL